MVDFNVEGLISAKETVSDSTEAISDALKEASISAESASESSEDAAQAFTELLGASESLESSLDGTENDIDDINDELEELQANSTEAAVALGGVGAVSDINAPGGLGERDLFDEFMADDPNINQSKLGNKVDVDPPDVRPAIESIRDVPTESQTQISVQPRNVLFPDEADLLEEITPLAGLQTTVDPIDFTEMGPDSQTALIPSPEDAIDTRDLVGGGSLQASFRDKAETIADVIPLLDSFINTASEANDVAGIDSPDKFFEGAAETISDTIPLLDSFTDSQGDANNAADDGQDTFNQLRNVIGRLLPELSSLSANLGPFTIGLSNLAVAVPSLIATIGLLVTVLGGLVTAILAVVAALGAFLALGVLSFAEQLESQFAGVTNRLEALEAIAKGAAAAFRDALAPLENAEFAGLSAAEFFIRILQDFISVVNATAKVLADLLGLEAVEEFFFRIEEALLTANEAGGDTVSFIEGLTDAVNVFLPVITDFIVTLINGAPEALAFAADIGEQVLPALEEFGKALLNVTVQLTRFGAIVAQTVLPVLSNLLNALGALGAALVFIADTVPGLSTAFLAFAATVVALTLAIAGVVGISSLAVTAFGTLATAVGTSAAALGQFVIFVGLVVGGLTLAIDGLAGMLKVLGLLEPTLSLINGFFGFLAGILQFVTDGADSLASTGGTLGEILRFAGNAAKFVAGVLITVAGAAGLVALGFQAVGFSGVTAISAISTALLSSGLLPILLAISAALVGIFALFKVLEDVVEAVLDPNEEADWLRRLNGDLATTVDTLQTITSLIQDIQEFGQVEATRQDAQNAVEAGRGLFPNFGNSGIEKILIDRILQSLGLAGVSSALTSSRGRQKSVQSGTTNITVNGTGGRKSDREKVAREVYREKERRERLERGN